MKKNMQPQPPYKNILCIRADNMGDVIMTGPAMRALKETFGARITLLTSQAGNLIAPFVPEVDAVLIANLPWVKMEGSMSSGEYDQLVSRLRGFSFDLAVIFTVYSQNPAPAALLCWQAGIPARLAFCRENPYALLTAWAPDKEPYSFIRHQVERDLMLVKEIGAVTGNQALQLKFGSAAQKTALEKLTACGVAIHKAWIVLHPGVSEHKREYPVSRWIELGRLLQKELGLQLLITGSNKDKEIAGQIATSLRATASAAVAKEQTGSGAGVFSIAGLLNIEEFIALLHESLLVISVNTGTVHIAAAVQTPVVVLYAQTNPQHEPWQCRSEVLPYSVPSEDQSRNEVIRYVNGLLYSEERSLPAAETIVKAVCRLLKNENRAAIPGHGYVEDAKTSEAHG
jgi:ADP-heptose:LPS heptosyltransferase